MILHFQNWTSPLTLSMLNSDKKPHGDAVIKVYTGDLREKFARPGLFTVESDDKPFGEDEVFKFQERESFTGVKLETDLEKLGLNEQGKRIFRALLRFSYEYGFCQRGMAVKKEDGSFAFNHPFEELDGVQKAILNPEMNNFMHLDIFLPESLLKLKKMGIDYDDPEKVVSFKDITEQRRKEIRSKLEGNRRSSVEA